MIRSKSGLRLIPEIYAVPRDKVELEQATPGTQPLEVAGRVPFMWAQSLYIVGRLIKESLVSIS
jgi:phosphorylase kinase alpha/beta subunit